MKYLRKIEDNFAAMSAAFYRSINQMFLVRGFARPIVSSVKSFVVFILKYRMQIRFKIFDVSIIKVCRYIIIYSKIQQNLKKLYPTGVGVHT